MKNSLFILLFIFTNFLFGQSNDIRLSYGKVSSYDNIYLSEGPVLSLGYFYKFKTNWTLGANAQINLLHQNPNYSVKDDGLVTEHNLMMFEGFEEILYLNASVGLSIGKEFKLKNNFSLYSNFGFLGVYIDHRYSWLSDNNGGAFDEFINELVDRDQFTLGMNAKLGLQYTLLDKFGIFCEITGEYLPFVKIGYLEKNILSRGFQVGASISF